MAHKWVPVVPMDESEPIGEAVVDIVGDSVRFVSGYIRGDEVVEQVDLVIDDDTSFTMDSHFFSRVGE